ncbi:MAG: bifunctional riboflavin kinase/FAD synthetase [Paracoccaceae bacterium]
MERIKGYRDLPEALRGATAALGNFDGVHLGHRALISAARRARPAGRHAVVTFEPHPRRYFRPAMPPFRLATADERARILASLGLDALFELAFDEALAEMSPERFVAEVLADGLGLSHVAVGEDFRFGKARAGDVQILARAGAAHGIAVTAIALEGEGTPVSSSMIRTHIREGRPDAAARLLGRWHTVSGPVLQGDQRGRTLGYPTANLAFGDQIVPAYGVYAAEVTVHDGPHAGRYPGVASIGERPTFGINAPNFEVHLFDFAGDLYGAEISTGLVAFLRGEVRFDGADALIAQMDRDSADARAALAAPSPG